MAEQVPQSEYLSVKQFVAHSGGGMSYSLVTKLAREGQLDSYKIGERKWRIHRDAERMYRERQQAAQE